jgi:hypothetical protein
LTDGAQHAHFTGADPILINSLFLVLHGFLVGLMGLGLLIGGTLLAYTVRSIAFLIWPVIVMGLLVCSWAVLSFGIAWTRPSAIRIDTFGLSGY